MSVRLDVQYQIKEFGDKYEVSKRADNTHIYELFHAYNEEARQN